MRFISTESSVMSKITVLLWIMHLVLIHIVDSSNVHYITPSPTTQCPGESCLTLSTLAANSSDYFYSNTSLIFLEGSHTLNSELIVSNINVSLTLSTNDPGTVAVICSIGTSLKFSDISQVQINGLEFIQCSAKVDLVDQFILKDSTFCDGNSDSALHLNHTNTSIMGSSFVSNTAGTYQGEIGILVLYSSDSNVSHHIMFSWLFPSIQSTGARVGGALFVTSSNVTISSSHFNGNTAQMGGAIFSQMGSSINITNSTFVNNSAIGCSDDGCLGGAMFIDSGCTVTAHNCTFMNNTAGYSGGAIALFQGTFLDHTYNVFGSNRAVAFGGAMSAYNRSRIIIDNSWYCNNTGRYGGAMYALSYGSISVNNSCFDNNEAVDFGGVILAYFSSSITVSYSSFNNNIACRSDGGVMYTGHSSSITVCNSSFDSSEAGNNGGVVFAEDNVSITLANSSFGNNKAGNSGGTLHALGNSSITVGDSSFDDNEAGINGGVMITNSNSSITIANSIFNTNKAGFDGGVISAYSNSSITIGSSSFDNSAAGDDGGVIFAQDNCNIIVRSSSFNKTKADDNGGVIFAQYSSSITVVNSSFNDNAAGNDGGIVYTYRDTTTIFKNNCTFFNNSAYEGGVAHVRVGSFRDLSNVYFGNIASNGGVITFNEGIIEITASRFINNIARNGGGVLYTALRHSKHVIRLNTSSFINNSADSGAVIALFSNAVITISKSVFSRNSAIRGGAILMQFGNNLTAQYCNFSHNLAKIDGGVIYSDSENIITFDNNEMNFNVATYNGGVACLLLQSKLNIKGNSCFFGNQARSGGVVYANESTTNVHSQTLLMANNSATEIGGAIYLSAAVLTFFSGNTSLVQNQAHSGGALYASESRVYGYGENLLMDSNTARDSGGAVYLSKANLSFVGGNNTFERNQATAGGAIYLNLGELVFSGGSSILIQNKANDGGAIYIDDSKLIVEMESQTKIHNNSALHHGGGLYLTTSILKVSGEGSHLAENKANSNGGGIHATNSSLIIGGAVYFVNNKAKNGGGISLEERAKLHGTLAGIRHIINLVANSASCYGGALYVDDKTNSDMCDAVNIQGAAASNECFSNSVFINVSDNSAGISGSNLFGGLLDRCIVHNKFSKEGGIVNFLNSSNIDKSQLDTITSHPVQLCFCRDNQPDCEYQPELIQINRRHLLSVSIELIAYDHVHQAVNASIQCLFNSSAGGLGEGQQIQNVGKACTELKYNLFTPNNREELTFSAVNSPCNDITGVSERSVMIEIICSCPIGFQRTLNETLCDCVCDKVLQSYKKTECNPITESIIRVNNFWISYINHSWSNSSGYVIYPHCPFDYCYAPDQQVSINLNLPNGSDAQCDFDRMGTLCGTCKPGLSVSLGSSKCNICPAYWPVLLVTIILVFIISGIGLVAFLLVLNLTVAIGTLNAIIFYANIVAANKSAFFPSGVSFASVFISWLNFDIGFDVCFFDGMDTYVKTWLQLAFPAYIIILVVAIIQLSYHINGFGHLVGKKDPVATLSTLILLSYTKLVQTIITTFSSATLVYPDGSKKSLWLPDATVEYFNSKHTVLFFTAVLILLVGLTYTLLLFSWQWLLYCPRRGVKWIINQKHSSFIEISLNPYTPKHRYWTGLLLLIRVYVYLVSAFNPSGDPRVTLLATNFVMTSLVIYIATFGVRMYQNNFINVMETLTYFNIMALAMFTWYTIDVDTNQIIITNLSVSITILQLTTIIIYHVYKHLHQKLFTTIQGSVICVKIRKIVTYKEQKRAHHKPVPVDEDIHQLHELLDIIDRPTNTNYYSIPQVQPKPAEPTQSVVELPKPQQAPASPPSLEAIEEEPVLESTEQQASKRDCIDMFPVGGNLSTVIDKNKQCINNYSGIDTAECSETSKNRETDIEQSTILKENSIPKPNSNAQISTYPLAESDIKQASEEAVEIPLSNNMDQSKQEVPPFPADIGEQEGVDSQCIIVEAEVHN